jgi:hypothetical protein
MRLHDPGRLPFLDEALFSLAVQRMRPVQVVVAIQGNAVAAEDVQRRLAFQPFAGEDMQAHKVVEVANPERRDIRARLLNRGIDAAQHRYLAFLDDDDVVYQSGYERLVARLRGGDAALAAGGTVRADFVMRDKRWIAKRRFDWVHSGTTQRDLIDRNFLPLHSFVIDRSRVDPADLQFDESLTRLEDYDFLLRLAASYRFDLACLGVPVCEYRLRRGADHVNPLATGLARTDAEWLEARRRIDSVKHRLAPVFARMPGPPTDKAPRDWRRAMRRALLHTGGWLPLALRVARDLRQHGVRRFFNEARRFARRH